MTDYKKVLSEVSDQEVLNKHNITEESLGSELFGALIAYVDSGNIDLAAHILEQRELAMHLRVVHESQGNTMNLFLSNDN